MIIDFWNNKIQKLFYVYIMTAEESSFRIVIEDTL